MNDVVRRLQDATHAVGEVVEAVPSFCPPEGRARRTRRRGRAWPWLVPVAAAAAVTVAIAGGVTVVRHGGGSAGPAAGVTAGPAVEPSFLVEVLAKGLAVRRISDGKVTVTVPGRTGERFTQVQAARDNRLFYAVTAKARGCGDSRIYRLVLDDDGRIGSFDPLPFSPPKSAGVTSLAVNGEGSALAYGLSPCAPEVGMASLVVTDTETGDSRTWTSSSAAVVRNVSMSADGRTLAFRRVGEVPVAVAVPSGAPGAAGPMRVSGAPIAGDAVLRGVAGGPTTPPSPVPLEGACLWSPRSPRESSPVTPSPSAGGRREVLVIQACRAPQAVWLLDTGSPGDLDKARAVTSTASSVPGRNTVFDVALTPDGKRVLAAVGQEGATRAKGTAGTAGVVEVVAYDVTSARAVETLYHGEHETPFVRGIDLDGTGERILILGAEETGTLTRGRYETLPARDTGGPALAAAW
ncbi:hypothetical protein AB0C10_05150 [Microbispora amethystogenes]|uniref:hypothetical protein n=1 Tax=Microbispora amethystogenes TaxID=1427754 RepID=UPI0033D0118E